MTINDNYCISPFFSIEETNPIGLTVTGEAEDSAQVVWYQPILGPGETLIGYLVSVFEVISENNLVLVDQYTTVDTSITVENLEPFTSYSLSVEAQTQGGSGEPIPITSVSVTTLEAGMWVHMLHAIKFKGNLKLLSSFQ